MLKLKIETLIRLYVEYDTPCDQYLYDPRLLLRFTQEYIARSGDVVSPEDLAYALLNLRKRGQAKGGLPRLRRDYQGRHAS